MNPLHLSTRLRSIEADLRKAIEHIARVDGNDARVGGQIAQDQADALHKLADDLEGETKP